MIWRPWRRIMELEGLLEEQAEQHVITCHQKDAILDSCKAQLHDTRANLGIAECAIEGLERQLAEVKRVRDDYRELALRRGATAHGGGDTWQQNAATAAQTLREEGEKIRSHQHGLMERLEQVWGDALSDEDLARLHASKDDG